MVRSSPCAGRRAQLVAHERKLREFAADPYARDNAGLLARSPPEPREDHPRPHPQAQATDRKIQKATREIRKTAPKPVSEVDLVALKRVVNRLLDHIIETRGVQAVPLEHRYYWEVPAPDRYRVEVDPGELDVGDLADDWAFVSRLLQDENRPVAYQLTELAPLLTYLGEVLARDLGEQGG